MHKIRIIKDVNEEVLQQQQTMSAQKCYFDPNQPFQRRLFNFAWQKEKVEKIKNFAKENPEEAPEEAAGVVVEYSLKRVMKSLNNLILTQYQKFFMPAAMKPGEKSLTMD